MHLQDGDNSTCVRRGLLRERRQCLVDGIPLHMFAVTIVIFFFLDLHIVSQKLVMELSLRYFLELFFAILWASNVFILT